MPDRNGSGNDTSLKQVFQRLLPAGEELMRGTVISVSPLKIQMVNDEKLILNERTAIIPWHLTDYTTKATYTVGQGTLNSVTTPNGEGPHTHQLASYTLSYGTITVHNALKLGEQVHVLALNNGKLYYVLDRVVS